MSQSPSLGDGRIAPCQCLVRIAETEKDDPQERLRTYGGVESGLMGKRAMGIWIIKRQRLFEMRPGRRRPADMHQISTGAQVTQNEPAGIVALTAQTQQILGKALRQIEFAADRVITRLSIRNVKVLRGGTQLFPQLSRPGIGVPGIWRRMAFYGCQDRAQGAVKFELLSLTFGVGRQQRQLVQTLLQLRGRFRHRPQPATPETIQLEYQHGTYVVL